MKVQCDCGAKYAMDATPDMLRNPVSFACPGCGVDLSARFNELIRQEFGNIAVQPREGLAPAKEIALPPPSAKPAVSAATSPAPPPQMRISINTPPPPPAAPTPIASQPVPPPPAPIPSAPPPPPPITPAPVRLHHANTPAAGAAMPDVVDTRFCAKHPKQRVTEKCRVCEKPICPQCMQLFGYVCSVHCRQKAEANNIKLPTFAGQRDVVQRKQGNKIGLLISLTAVVIIAVIGVWIWYAWFGSRPHPTFAIRFENEPAISGKSAFCPDNQIVFIHGDKLARYDIKSKKQVWLNHIVDKKKIGEQAAAEVKRMQEEAAKSEYTIRVPSVEKHTKDSIRSAEQNLELLVLDKNIWVADGSKVVRYDWDSGQQKQELDFHGGFERAKRVGDEMETRGRTDDGLISITRFNLVSGQVKTNTIGERPPLIASTNLPASTNKNAKTIAANKPTAKPVADPNARRQLDPQKIADALANAPAAAKIAAPATIAVALNQQRALNMMDEMDGVKLPPGVDQKDAYKYRSHSEIIATRDGFIRFTVRMLEENIVERNAMKAAPKKSALGGNLSVTATVDVANELLNEMQRNAGGGTVREDHSRYLVTVHSGGGRDVPDWEGEVVGEPSIYPQPNVTVVTGGKSLIVLDKSNKKKWESTLNYPIAGRGRFAPDDEGEERTGLGPVVERGDTLFVFDKGVLSAFELANGNAIWRLPSVGISGMFFDNSGSIYVNTTTASPEAIKFSKQIDVSNRTGDVVVKLDAKTGKEIWNHSMGGNIAYLDGKFIYTVTYMSPTDEDEELNPDLVAIGAQTRPYVRIRRINPKNGQVMWDHFQQRGALDVNIHENTFQIVFKKEVQVLKFLSF